MTTYEIQLAGGKVVAMSGTDPIHACTRAADLYQLDAIAWRHPRVALVVGCQTED